jgi:hypothetical protein
MKNYLPYLIGAVGTILAVLAILAYVQASFASLYSTQKSAATMFAECIVATEMRYNKMSVAIDYPIMIANQQLCESNTNNLLKLQDYSIRKIAFYRQHAYADIFMVMVFLITLSGLILSAIQLHTSYILALNSRIDRSSEITSIDIESARISLRSSIVGISILIVSLAFFIVYALYIYRIEII